MLALVNDSEFTKATVLRAMGRTSLIRYTVPGIRPRYYSM